MNLDFSLANGFDAAVATSDATETGLSAAARAATRRSNDPQSRFDIYRADQVRLTSTLFGGGDWHWRLTGASGAVVVDCGGYRNEAQCLAVVSALRLEAGFAVIFTEADPEHATPEGLPFR